MTEVYNTDVVGYYNKLTRFQYEVMKSASSNLGEFSDADQTRTMSYLDAADTYLDHVNAEPELDVTDPHPHLYTLEPRDEIVNADNEDINDLVRVYEIAINAVISGESARKASGFTPYDYARQKTYTTKMRNFMVNYVQETTPLDKPKSSPEEPITGPGKK